MSNDEIKGDIVSGSDVGKKPKRTILVILIVAILAIGAFIGGLIYVNSVLMPQIAKIGAEVEVPNICGMDVESARKILEERGLILDDKIIEKYDSTTPEGYVISQIPPANSVIKEGRHISVTVSKGEEEIIVPNLVRVSLRQARLLLESSNLVLGTVERRFYDVDSSAVDTTAPNADSLLAPILEDYIISQNPPPETKVQRGTAVNISLSLGPTPKDHKMPNLVGRPYGDIWPWINVYKLKIATVSNKYAENILPNTVLEQKPPAGSDINDGDEVHLILSTDTKP